ncbi:hypothetical protein BGZ50_002900 [Haplosporangium sp. Z 11]|nr:hypothetical protein BGZ50_002900 [Haplosporangium sp. Z 11]
MQFQFQRMFRLQPMLQIRSTTAQTHGRNRAIQCPHRSSSRHSHRDKHCFYSTSSTTNTSTTSAIGSSSTTGTSSNPSASNPASTSPGSRQSTSGSENTSGWVRRISLMSASAAAGALAYAKLDPASAGGFSGMPVGKMQPTILGTEEPDEVFVSAQKTTPEKIKEIKQSVRLQNQLEELELVHEYKALVKQGEWKEADPYWYLTKVTEPHHLTAGTLRGENMLSVHPLKFERKDEKAIVLFMHLGRSLCGHDRIIHGGLLATLLDEATGMVALPNLPFHIGFTANLNVNYRKPVKADQFVMVRAEFQKSEGRKGYTVASIHDLHGNTLVECTALYVSPKNPVVMVANYVKNSLGF